VVPPNWDSWGKIRVLREGFDVEAVNGGWSLDIEESSELVPNGHTNGTAPSTEGGAVAIYEETIRDPSLDALQATAYESNGLKLEVSSVEPQTFLASQLEILDKIRQDTSGTDSSRAARGRQSQEGDESRVDEGRVNEHIGPVQFNMGGIQVDADDMLQRLKVIQYPHHISNRPYH
jgi:dynein light intermediate chain 1, cytosolic